MDMKVYDRNLAGAGSTASTHTQDVQKTGSGVSGGSLAGRAGGGDQVSLSGTLGKLSQALSAQGSQRAARTAALASAYRSGTYQPNVAGTVKGLISEALSASGGEAGWAEKS